MQRERLSAVFRDAALIAAMLVGGEPASAQSAAAPVSVAPAASVAPVAAAPAPSAVPVAAAPPPSAPVAATVPPAVATEDTSRGAGDLAYGSAEGGVGLAEQLVHVPVSKLFPGGVAVNPKIDNPVAQDPKAIQRGMEYFTTFNCVGCHAANGAGGMGPSLSNSVFIYGAAPENIYLTILQGRPRGMPAWGAMLPDHIIWDLVSYVKSISNAPSTEWGTTTSLDALKIEQVPAEYQQTATPWQYTEPFSYGKKPYTKP